MAISTVPFFKTSDGKTFDEEGKALAHEAALTHGAEVEAFLDAHFPAKEDGSKPGPVRAIGRKVLLTYLGSKAA